MRFSKFFHFFRIGEKFYGGEQPPYQPEFDSRKIFDNPEMQSMSDDFRELLKHFQVFIDLREYGEPYYEYKDSLPEHIVCERVPIRDTGIPESPEQIQPLLYRIREYLEAGNSVYLHCHGGCGRTGTIAGCWLSYRWNLTGEEAVKLLNQRFSRSLKGRQGKACPENAEQERFIMQYAAWRRMNVQR